ncbi:hypothetical protein BJ165DRAFT_1571546 [Panaeolus papilionaceus]|nr:hypothetical protein BJ165DRAFT_1571546 [Panaeolus papilionaceus]
MQLKLIVITTLSVIASLAIAAPPTPNLQDGLKAKCTGDKLERLCCKNLVGETGQRCHALDNDPPFDFLCLENVIRTKATAVKPQLRSRERGSCYTQVKAQVKTRLNGSVENLICMSLVHKRNLTSETVEMGSRICAERKPTISRRLGVVFAVDVNGSELFFETEKAGTDYPSYSKDDEKKNTKIEAEMRKISNFVELRHASNIRMAKPVVPLRAIGLVLGSRCTTTKFRFPNARVYEHTNQLGGVSI